MKIHNGGDHEEDRRNWEFDDVQKAIWNDDFIKEQETIKKWGAMYTPDAFYGPHELWLYRNIEDRKRRDREWQEYCQKQKSEVKKLLRHYENKTR